MGRRGRNQKLYIATNFETPVQLLVARSGDITLGFEKDSEDYDFRDAATVFSVTGIKKAPITFKYVRKGKAVVAESVYTALMDSFLNSSPLYVHLLDGSITVEGSAGWRGAYEVKKMAPTWPVKGVEAFDVELVPVEHAYKNTSNAIVEVAWEAFTVPAP